jgi:hypothetical protein
MAIKNVKSKTTEISIPMKKRFDIFIGVSLFVLVVIPSNTPKIIAFIAITIGRI